MPKAKLTKAFLQKVKPDPTRTTIYWDEALPCLGLKVFASGRASYVAQFRLRGSRITRQVTFGSVTSLSPEQAREKARKHLEAARDGVDLDRAVRNSVRAAEEERRRIASLLSVSDAVDQFLRWMGTAVSRRSKRTPTASTVRANGQWLSRFRSTYGHLPLCEIGPAEVHSTINQFPFASRRNCYGALRRLFAWALKNGHVAEDPTRTIEPPARPSPRDNTPTPEQVRMLLEAADRLACEGRWHRVQRDALWMLALTAQRRAEVAAMDWSDINFDKSEWRQPASKNKSKREHTVPLGPLALRLLRDRWDAAGRPSAGLALPGVRSNGSMNANLSDLQARLRKETGVKFVLHDLRRSAVSAMAEAGIDFAVADTLLNHEASQSRGGMLKVYQRAALTRFKRNAIELWEAVLFLKEGAEILPLNRRTA